MKGNKPASVDMVEQTRLKQSRGQNGHRQLSCGSNEMAEKLCSEFLNPRDSAVHGIRVTHAAGAERKTHIPLVTATKSAAPMEDRCSKHDHQNCDVRPYRALPSLHRIFHLFQWRKHGRRY
jgi:hypothetical protein